MKFYTYNSKGYLYNGNVSIFINLSMSHVFYHRSSIVICHYKCSYQNIQLMCTIMLITCIYASFFNKKLFNNNFWE